jgi:protochlorophyllide reductase
MIAMAARRILFIAVLLFSLCDCFVHKSFNTRNGFVQSRLEERKTVDESENDKDNHDGINRRRALTSTGVAMLSIWLGDAIGKDNIASKWVASAAEEIIAADEQQQQPRTILLTGCNSGIGFEAARILARKGDTLILACRTKEKADETARKILAETETAKLVPCECDLTSLQSVRKFVDSITTTTNQLDVVCYNAGIALNTDGDIERTVEGFERTVGTNHLGHFYLHHLLQPKIVNNKTGRVVITASSVHDPESPGGKQGKSATLGNLEGFVRDGRNFEMVDGQPYNGDKAYKDSKLCNVLFCRELQRRLGASDTTKNIVVNSFSPGLITSTGFFRYQNPVFSSIFNVVATNVLKVAETPQYGGAALAYMTTVESRGEFWDSPPGTSYKSGNAAFGKEFNVSPVSKEGKVDAKAKKLWELSEKLVGI